MAVGTLPAGRVCGPGVYSTVTVLERVVRFS
jgi:hypothetical protein